MRRFMAGLGLSALVGTCAMVGLSAPANASTTPTATASGYVLYAAYNWPDECSSAGYAGQQAGKWAYYYCDEIDPASADGPGLYDLYVAY